jgi:hypothetical protein
LPTGAEGAPAAPGEPADDAALVVSPDDAESGSAVATPWPRPINIVIPAANAASVNASRVRSTLIR